MADPITLEQLAKRVATKINQSLEEAGQNKTGVQNGRLQLDFALDAEDRAELAQIQAEYIANSDLERIEAIMEFSTRFNMYLKRELSHQNTMGASEIGFEIPDLNPVTPGYDQDRRDQRAKTVIDEEGPITGYQALNLNGDENLTVETARDVFRENKEYYTNNFVEGQKITSGDQLQKLLQEKGPALNPAFRKTLDAQVRNHFLNSKSEFYPVSEDGINSRTTEQIRANRVEPGRSRTMRELAQILHNHPDKDLVFEKIFYGDHIDPAIGDLPRSLTSNNPRGAIMTSKIEVREADKLREAENIVLEMAAIYGPTGADGMIVSILNNPELLNKPYVEAVNQLNPAVTEGIRGYIAAGYHPRKLYLRNLSENLLEKNPNESLGSILGNALARDMPVTPQIPDIQVEISRPFNPFGPVPTDAPALDEPGTIVNLKAPPEDKPKPGAVGAYMKSYQNIAWDTPITFKGYGATTQIPLDGKIQGRLQVDGGVISPFGGTNFDIGIADATQVDVPDGFLAYMMDDNNIVLADPNSPAAGGLGAPVDDLIQTGPGGRRYVDMGGADATVNQRVRDGLAADLNVKLMTSDGKFIAMAGGSYGPDMQRASAGFETKTEGGLAFSGTLNYHRNKLDTDIETRAANPENVTTVYKGVSARIGTDGKPVFDPEVEKIFNEYDRVTLTPREQELQEVPNKLKRFQQVGIQAKQAYGVQLIDKVREMGIVPKSEYVELQTEEYQARGIVPKAEFVDLQEELYEVEGIVPLEKKTEFKREDRWLVVIPESEMRNKHWPCHWEDIPLSAKPPTKVWITVEEAKAYNEHIRNGGKQWSVEEGGYYNGFLNSDVPDDDIPFSPEDFANARYYYNEPSAYDQLNRTSVKSLEELEALAAKWGMTVDQLRYKKTTINIPVETNYVRVEGRLLTEQEARDMGIPEDKWIYEKLEGGPFTREELEELGYSEELWQKVDTPIITKRFDELTPEEQANIIPDSRRWERIEGDLLTPEQAAYIPEKERMWEDIPGQTYTEEQLIALNIPRNEWGTPTLVNTGEYKKREDLGPDEHYREDSGVWRVDDGEPLIDKEEADRRGIPNNERDWEVREDGELLDPNDPRVQDYPDDEIETVKIPDPEGTLILLEDGVEYDEDQDVIYKSKDPAEILTLEQAIAESKKPLGMPLSEFEYILVANQNELWTEEEFKAFEQQLANLGLPALSDDMRVMLWVDDPSGKMIPLEQAIAEGIPYLPTDIRVTQIPEVDSEGKQLFDVSVEKLSEMSTQSELLYNTQSSYVTGLQAEGGERVKTVDFAISAGIPVWNKWARVDVGAQYMKTTIDPIYFSGTLVNENLSVDEFDPHDEFSTDDDIIRSVDYPNRDDIATGKTYGQDGGAITPAIINNSFAREENQIGVILRQTATRASVSGQFTAPLDKKKNTTLGIGGEAGQVKIEQRQLHLRDAMLTDTKVDTKKFGYGAVRGQLTHTFNGGAQIAASYQHNLGKEGAGADAYKVSLKVPLGGDRNKEQKAAIQRLEIQEQRPVPSTKMQEIKENKEIIQQQGAEDNTQNSTPPTLEKQNNTLPPPPR